jgi:unsaturated rhamnogalacturonyl hydrolase
VDSEHVLAALLGMQRLSWEQGVAAQALLDLGRYELVRVLARDAVTRQAPDGRLAEVGEGNLVNGAANAEAVGWAGHAAAYALQLRWLTDTAPRAADGTLFHVGRQVWVDTVYMVVPALPRAAAAAQLAGHRHRLFDPDARLYAHRWDEDAQRLVRAAFWASGNGWVVAALARALRAAPEPDWAAHATDVINGCLAFRTAGGLFHDVLDDPGTFEEVTAAEMVAYAILTGVADGWLPGRYAAAGRELLEAAATHVDPDGFLYPACGSPGFDRPGISAEAQAFFLLAWAARDRVLTGRPAGQGG